MATLHVSEVDAVRNIAELLAKVRAGTEVVIESEDATVAVLAPPGRYLSEPETGYDEWFRAQVQEAMDSDPSTDLDGDEVEKYFAERRRVAATKLKDINR